MQNFTKISTKKILVFVFCKPKTQQSHNLTAAARKAEQKHEQYSTSPGSYTSFDSCVNLSEAS